MISSIFDHPGNAALLHFLGRPGPSKLTPSGAVSGPGVDHVFGSPRLSLNAVPIVTIGVRGGIVLA